MIFSKDSGFVRKPLVRPVREEHPNAYYVADVVDTRVSFARNFGGYVRNDIAVINEQNNSDVVSSLLDRLVVRQQDGKVDIPDADLRSSLRSRYCQTAAEQTSWLEHQIEIADNLAVEREKAAQAAQELAKNREERLKLRESLTADEKEEIRKAKRSQKLKELVDEQ